MFPTVFTAKSKRGSDSFEVDHFPVVASKMSISTRGTKLPFAALPAAKMTLFPTDVTVGLKRARESLAVDQVIIRFK